MQAVALATGIGKARLAVHLESRAYLYFVHLRTIQRLCGYSIAATGAHLVTLRAICSNASSDLRREHAELRARLESERQLRILAAQIVGAAQIAPIIGAAIEKFAQAMRAPLPRGRAGGLARASTAWRYFDGTFMPESEKSEAYLADYERYASGGRARAARASRNKDGTFAPC